MRTGSPRIISGRLPPAISIARRHAPMEMFGFIVPQWSEPVELVPRAKAAAQAGQRVSRARGSTRPAP